MEKQMVKGSYWLGLLSSLIALGLRSLNAFGIMTPEVVKQGQTVWYMSFYQGSASVFSGRHCHGELRLGAWRKDLKGIPSHRHFGNRAPLAGRRQTVECRDIRISESEGMASPRCVRLECVKKKSEECLKKIGDGAPRGLAAQIGQRVLHSRVAPIAVLSGHAGHPGVDLILHAGTSRATPSPAIVFPGDQLAMPRQERLRGDGGGQFMKHAPAQFLGSPHGSRSHGAKNQ